MILVIYIQITYVITLTNYNNMESLQKELYFKVADSDFELQNCYRLRYKVYCEEKRWISPSDFPDKMERDEYDAKAVQVIAMNEDFKIVGTMRILREADFSRLPYQDHPAMNGNKVLADKAAELSRFVVTADQSRYYVVKGLLRAVYQTSRKMGIDNWIFMYEPSLKRLLASFKFYTDPVCLPTKYFGALTMVGLADIPKVEKVWRMNDPETWKFYTNEMAMMFPATEIVT